MGKSFFNLLCPYIQFLFYSFFIIPCYDISFLSFIFSPISNLSLFQFKGLASIWCWYGKPFSSGNWQSIYAGLEEGMAEKHATTSFAAILPMKENIRITSWIGKGICCEATSTLLLLQNWKPCQTYKPMAQQTGPVSGFLLHRRSEKIPGILSINSQHKITCLNQNRATDWQCLREKFCTFIFLCSRKL